MLLVAVVALAQGQIAPPRFVNAWPYPALPTIKLDERQAKVGVAQETVYRERLQGRVLWIDGTANLERCSSDEKIAALMVRVASAGFNTVVYDIKPIVGRTLYPSKLAEKMTEWKGQTMPPEYDPLAAMVREAHANGLSILVSMNAFSEGHSYSKRDEDLPETQFGKPGWGYEHPELQTHVLRSEPFITSPRSFGLGYGVSPTANKQEDVATVYTSAASLPAADYYLALDEQGVIVSSGTTRPTVGFSFVAFKDNDSGLRSLPEFFPVGLRPDFSAATQIVPHAQEQDQIPLMMNPHHPEVQQRTFDFVDEVFANYDVDGLLFDDRLRFAGLDADFSPYTRELFEKYVNKKVDWPNDIYLTTFDLRLRTGIDPGPLFDAWLTFRAQTLTDWVKQVRTHVPEGKQFGIYAGSWYGDYARYGNNYGSDQLSAGFPWLTRHYRETGFAKELDLLITGCYYAVPTIVDAMRVSGPIGRTVEAAGVVSNRVARDQCWTYAGIMLSDFKGDKELLGKAMQAAAATTQGVMVFDLSHDIDQYWEVFEKAFLPEPKRAPHERPSLIDLVRRTRVIWEQNGWKEPPFPFFPGAPGAGF
jgi:hypothetical protein